MSRVAVNQQVMQTAPRCLTERKSWNFPTVKKSQIWIKWSVFWKNFTLKQGCHSDSGYLISSYYDEHLMGWLPTKTNYEKHHAPNSPDLLSCAHGFPATRKLNGLGDLHDLQRGAPPPATEHRIESIQQDEGEERHQNESCCKLHSMQPGQTCHLDVSTFLFPLKMGGRHCLIRLLFGIVSKTVLTVFCCWADFMGCLVFFALVAEPFLGSTVHCATLFASLWSLSSGLLIYLDISVSEGGTCLASTSLTLRVAIA